MRYHLLYHIHCLLFSPFRPTADIQPPSRAGSHRPTRRDPYCRLDVLGVFTSVPIPSQRRTRTHARTPTRTPGRASASATGARLPPRLAEGFGHSVCFLLRNEGPIDAL
jgi:hypothetical protein